MIKKIITIFLAFIFLFSALTSCSDIPSEDSAPETTLSVTEESEEMPEETVIHSFYAERVLYSYAPEEDYAYLVAVKGTKEKEKWKRIYVDPEKNKDLLIYYEEGEIYEVFYFGEITSMADGECGYVEQLHSFRIATSPRKYDGIDYSVAVLSEGFNKNAIRPISLAAEGKSEHFILLLAQSFDKFNPMIGSCFMFKFDLPDNPTYLQQKTIAFRNQRRQLLDVFDAEFFSNNDLLMIFIESGSGSERYDVENISIESGLCNVTVRITEPDGTCDMAYWIIFVSIPKEVSAAITEYKYEVLPYEWKSQDR